MLAIKFPDIMSVSITFETILSIRVFEWLVILVGCKINSKNGIETREPENSLV